MSDQVVKAKDDLGNPHDIAGQLTDGSWGMRVVGELTSDQVSELRDIVDRAGRLLGHVTVDNDLNLSTATLDALETINGNVSGTVALDAATLAALETISVSNFPADYDISDRAGRLLGHVSVDNFPSSVEITNDSGNPIPISAPSLPLPSGAATESTVANRFSDGGETTAVRINTIGDNSILTPASGNSLKIKWIGMSAPASNTEEVLVIVKLGTTVKYRWNLDYPGQFSHWQILSGGVDEPLVVNLSAAVNVDLNYTYEEV